MYRLIRPLLFALPAETSHNLALGTMSLVSRSEVLCTALEKLCRHPSMHNPVQVMGLDFPNAIGLAAGLDKHGVAADAFASLGLGFIEQGTVTPLPQDGNPRPRMFRLEQDHALINRMGFNSVGLESFASNCSRTRGNHVRGINIGKNAVTPIERAVDDYLVALRGVYDFADYVAINISSPNTRNLRDLQSQEALEPLLEAVATERAHLRDRHGRHVPLVVKVSPDMDSGQVDDVAGLLRRYEIDGIAATNTTLSREGLKPDRHTGESGGLSGSPLGPRSTQTIEKLYRNLQGEIPIIGVGGIGDVESAMEKRQAGADLVQLYTGLVYNGPGLIRDIAEAFTENSR